MSFPPSACQGVADIGIIIDGSGSIRDMNPADRSYDNWDLLLKFVINVVEHFTVSPTGNHVGLVVFSDRGQLLFKLDKYYDTQGLIEAVQKIVYPGRNTNTSGGLYVARSQLFTGKDGDRPDVPNIAIVITDGKSTFDSQKTLPVAEDLRKDGVQVFSVGITTDVDEDELKGISSPPQVLNQNYFTSTDFQMLDGVLEGLLSQACGTTAAPTRPCKLQHVLHSFSSRSETHISMIVLSLLLNPRPTRTF